MHWSNGSARRINLVGLDLTRLGACEKTRQLLWTVNEIKNIAGSNGRFNGQIARKPNR